jgi:hypothetical protein
LPFEGEAILEVGLVTTIGGLLGLAVQTPIGAAIDETHAKRGIVVLALAVLAVTAAVIFLWPTFWPVDNLCQIDGRIVLAGEHASYIPAGQEGEILSALDAIARLHKRVLAI